MKLTIAQFIQLWSASDGSLVKFKAAVSAYKMHEANEAKEDKAKKEKAND